MITFIGKFGGLVLTYGKDNFIYCVAHFDTGKLQILTQSCLSEQDEQI